MFVLLWASLLISTLCHKLTGFSQECHRNFTRISPEFHQSSLECHKTKTCVCHNIESQHLKKGDNHNSAFPHVPDRKCCSLSRSLSLSLALSRSLSFSLSLSLSHIYTYITYRYSWVSWCGHVLSKALKQHNHQPNSIKKMGGKKTLLVTDAGKVHPRPAQGVQNRALFRDRALYVCEKRAATILRKEVVPGSERLTKSGVHEKSSRNLVSA